MNWDQDFELYFRLTIGMKYFGISVYWYTVSQLTLNININTHTHATHTIIKLNKSIIYNEFNILFYKNQIK